jgi:hypothetical protein
MLETVATLTAWFAFMACVGYYGAWAASKWTEKSREKKKKLKETIIPVGISLGGSEVDHNTTPKIRLGVIEAMNGRILEVATATPIMGHNHHDWKMEMYVVPEGQKLSEAIATVMLMKGLEQ